jgi:hypothetical protein
VKRRENADELVAELMEIHGNPKHEIHLPAPSYFPFLVGVGVMLIGYGILYHTRPWGIPVLVVGGMLTVAAFIAWGTEPLEEIHDDHHDEHEDDDGHGAEAELEDVDVEEADLAGVDD